MNIWISWYTAKKTSSIAQECKQYACLMKFPLSLALPEMHSIAKIN